MFFRLLPLGVLFSSDRYRPKFFWSAEEGNLIDRSLELLAVKGTMVRQGKSSEDAVYRHRICCAGHKTEVPAAIDRRRSNRA